MPNTHMHHMNTDHKVCDTIGIMLKHFDQETELEVSSLVSSMKNMLYNEIPWPSHRDEAKEYSCLVEPEKMMLVFWERAVLICMIDYLAHHAATQAKRMEEIGLGHMEPNKLRWILAALEHCKIDLQKPRIHRKPKPPVVEDCPDVDWNCDCHNR